MIDEGQIIDPADPVPPEPKKRGRRKLSTETGGIPDQTLAPVAPELLTLQGDPAEIVEQAIRAAESLKRFLEDPKRKKLIINGKRHLFFEDWQLLGRFYGITCIEKFSTYVNHDGIKGYAARSEALLIPKNQVISAADSECLDDEPLWRNKPLFQLCSMAQTRANAKVLRNVLAWVVIVMGYSPTPAEEVEKNEEEEKPQVEPEESWADKFWKTAKASRKSGKDVSEYLKTLGFSKLSQVPTEKQAEAIKWASSGGNNA